MALANFFDRAVTGASNILQGFDENMFRQILEKETVGLVFDQSAVATTEGRITLELSANLLARLYPNIAIIAGRQLKEVRTSIVELIKGINPDISIKYSLKSVTRCIVVGQKRCKIENSFYIGSDRWVCKLSGQEPVGSCDSNNAIGAAAAACFGAANIFRSIFREQLIDAEPDNSINISLLDYKDDGLNEDIDNVELKDWHFVGCGAIGNGLIWTLSKMSSLAGRICIIDNEEVELSNLQRYVLMKQEHVGISKVRVARDLFNKSKLNVNEHPITWETYLQKRGNYKIKNVAVSVDSGDTRIAIQAVLPYHIVNAWTQTGDLGISRHYFDDENACLACLYMPTGKKMNDDEIIAQALKLPSAIQEIRKLLYQDTGLDRTFLRRIAESCSIPIEELAPYEGQSLRALYQGVVCGGIILKFQNDDSSSDALVPMAFQSVLAGIMQTAEIVSYASGLRSQHLPVKTSINLLRPLAEYRNIPGKKNVSGNCICQDTDYLDVYKEKWRLNATKITQNPKSSKSAKSVATSALIQAPDRKKRGK